MQSTLYFRCDAIYCAVEGVSSFFGLSVKFYIFPYFVVKILISGQDR